MASLPNWPMFFLISPIICVVAALIFQVVPDPSTLYTDHIQWLLLFLLLPFLLLLAFFFREKRSSSSSASSSSSSSCSSTSDLTVPARKHEVFLSFRGPDTRYGFLSHLCLALSQKKIDYFVDDQKLLQGDEISPALFAAIERSKISLVIFSENYASSTWCLAELVHINECMRNQSQTVIPIFYKTDPSTVRHQKGSYKEAFARHERRFDKLKLQKWRDVLKNTADLSGFHSSNYKTEADFIIEIVQCVLKRLNMTSPKSDLKGLVGIEKHIAHLEALLCEKTQRVLIIGIWGMGGIGKTTIAEVLFNRLYNEYEGRYFVNVREGLQKLGRAQLKEKLLSKLLGGDLDIVMHNGILFDCQRRLQLKKVFVVLDDINRSMQLEILIGGREWVGPGSRIIATSRNKDVFAKECDYIHEVKPLSSEEALQLFNLNALPEVCLGREQDKLSEMVVKYCKGNPLAIKVLGCSLHGRDENEWKNKLEKFDKILDPDIQDVLQSSYDELDREQKDIFLYLACFFEYESKERIISLLEGDYYMIDGLRALQNRALITFKRGKPEFMHDLIRKMGHEIVRKNCPKNPGLHYHLWDASDIYKVLKNNMGTEEIESISLKMKQLKRDLHLTPQSFAKMDNLKLLRFEHITPREARFRVYAPEEDFVLPAELRFIHWDSYSSKSIPLRFCLDNLVELRMRHSCLQKLWDGIQELPNLKVINLFGSKKLVELPNLSKAPKLEYVELSSCDSLWHVPLWPPNAWKSKEDDHLHLNSLSTPTLQYVLPSLHRLYLNKCGHISFGFPDNINLYLPLLHTLEISQTNLESLPASIMELTKLTTLYVNDCRSLRHIPKLPPSIVIFVATNCTSLETLQFSSSSMHMLSHKNRLFNIRLENCRKLSEDTREAVAMHYKLSTEIIISAGREYNDALLYFPGSKVPECIRSCGSKHDSVSVPLELPPHSKAMGFIFYFLTQGSFRFKLEIKCHIEVSNVAKVQFICGSIHSGRTYPLAREFNLNHVLLWYKSSSSLKIMEELSRIKDATTTDDPCARVWFELPDNEYLLKVKEWGVYPIFISSEPHNLFEL